MFIKQNNICSKLTYKKIKMKTLFLTTALIFFALLTNAQQYMQMTTVESVVPGGFGRSRLITTDDKGSEQEIDLENFFSLVGINFGNIRNNDKISTSKISDLVKEGWELSNVTSGVYSADKSTGIFITRYIFKKP
jgi:hypothetical protein